MGLDVERGPEARGDATRAPALARMTMPALEALFARGPVVALVPCGSVEPHGPHLPLGTDAVLSEKACEVAAARLVDGGQLAVIAPPIPYGVTEFAAGFAGAVSVPAAALTAFARATTEALLAAGFRHVCLVNNHLEPAQDAALRAAVAGLEGRASFACPLERRFARTLGAEFKSGACHAGRYETSLVLAAPSAADVDLEALAQLPPVGISLSDGIRAGSLSFQAMGMTQAYTGAPAEASATEGEALYERLADMIVTTVRDALGASPQPEAP